MQWGVVGNREGKVEAWIPVLSGEEVELADGECWVLELES